MPYDRSLEDAIVQMQWTLVTVFENRPKSRIQHCDQSELRLHFEWTKVHLQMPKMVEKLKNSNATF